MSPLPILVDILRKRQRWPAIEGRVVQSVMEQRIIAALDDYPSQAHATPISARARNFNTTGTPQEQEFERLVLSYLEWSSGFRREVIQEYRPDQLLSALSARDNQVLHAMVILTRCTRAEISREEAQRLLEDLQDEDLRRVVSLGACRAPVVAG